MNNFVGVDLGGTHLRAAVLDAESGNHRPIRLVATQARDGHASVIQRMADLIEEVIRESGHPREAIGGVGIGVPGAIDMEQGLVHYLPNLAGHWLEVPLKSPIEERIHLPVHLINDARSMTLGEWTFGAGRGSSSMLCLAIGTGIGGGFIIDGKLHLGLGGVAGELGHQIIEPEGPLCGCGSRGCLETLASGPAIIAMGLKAIAHGQITRIGELVGYDLNKVTPKVIYQAALEGDAIAAEIFERAGYYIGLAIVNNLAAIGSESVVIGGGVAQAGERLLDPIRRTVQARLRILPLEKIRIEPAQLGADAGLIGAAVWASLKNSHA